MRRKKPNEDFDVTDFFGSSQRETGSSILKCSELYHFSDTGVLGAWMYFRKFGITEWEFSFDFNFVPKRERKKRGEEIRNYNIDNMGIINYQIENFLKKIFQKNVPQFPLLFLIRKGFII